MNTRLFFISIMTLCYGYINVVFSDSPVDRLTNITIIEDSPNYDNYGYNNCNMVLNGELQLIQNVIKDGDVVFDVGANKGSWSLNVFNCNKSALIYCFEPIPEFFQILPKTLNGNNFKSYQLAISDYDGSSDFYYYPTIPGLSTIHRRNDEVETKYNLKPVCFSVITTTIDSFCKTQSVSKIDYLKIDVEGGEWGVIKGSAEMLANIECIQFEYGGCYLDANTYLKDVYDFLTTHNFTIYRIVPEGLIKVSKWRNELENFQYTNYLAIRN
ncbi:MAG: FkbM family methyltransferase [Chlamydiota bacterium]|nr:FkbM family methyltransferase [Chlamydiota bacterium]